MKIVITGSHFTPAQAVIEKLKEESDVNLLYIGRKYTREGDKSPSAESQILPRMGIKFLPITTGRLQRTFTSYTIPSLLKIPVGLVQSFYYLLREKPDVVLSFGGYAGVPVVFTAWLLSIPVIIHEQTLTPGLANIFSSWFANKIAVSFKDNEFTGSKVILTGNPLRKEIINTDEEQVNPEIKEIVKISQKERLPLILVTGGNQGSHVINESVAEVLENLTKIGCVIHQTGDAKFNDFEKLKDLSNHLSNEKRYLVTKWLNGNEMGWLLKNSSLVLSRAGMNTLLEISYFTKPVLVIPLPTKEQEFNACYFQKLGNALVLWQKDLDGENLLKKVKEGLEELGGLEEKAQEAQKVVIPDAASRLALETLLLGKRS